MPYGDSDSVRKSPELELFVGVVGSVSTGGSTVRFAACRIFCGVWSFSVLGGCCIGLNIVVIVCVLSALTVSISGTSRNKGLYFKPKDEK